MRLQRGTTDELRRPSLWQQHKEVAQMLGTEMISPRFISYLTKRDDVLVSKHPGGHLACVAISEQDEISVMQREAVKTAQILWTKSLSLDTLLQEHLAAIASRQWYANRYGACISGSSSGKCICCRRTSEALWKVFATPWRGSLDTRRTDSESGTAAFDLACQVMLLQLQRLGHVYNS